MRPTMPHPRSHAPRVVVALLVAAVLAASACSSSSSESAAATDAGPVASASAAPRPARLRVPLDEAARRDPVAAVLAGRPTQKHGARAWCAQVKSVDDEAQARTVAAEIERAVQAPVSLVRADLGARGTWWRVCVGAEPSPDALVERATRWTADAGALAPWMAPGAPGEARFLVLETTAPDAAAPTVAAATALLSASPVPGAGIFVVEGASAGGRLLAGTVRLAGPGTDALVVDAHGAELVVDERPLRASAAPESCASCAAALAEGPVVARSVVGAGDLGPWPGEELLVEETTREGARILSLVARDGGRLVKQAAVLVATARPGLLLDGRARVVEADGDALAELAVVRTEVPVVADAACAVRVRADLYDVRDGAFRKLDDPAVTAQTGGAPGAGEGAGDRVTRPALTAIGALDMLEDHGAASRACAAYLARNPSSALALHCIERVRVLAAAGRLIDAVNAGGLLAAAAPPLRAAVAPALYEAAHSLDVDPRLTAAEADCSGSPLVSGVSTRDLAQNLKLATARARERLNLADLDDAVFVAGQRDFGPGTPFGGLAARWLERVKLSLPARHAAIEALLVSPPQVLEEAPLQALPVTAPSASFGGRGGAP